METFRKFNKNRTGFVSRTDFVLALATIGENVKPEDKAKAVQKSVDANGKVNYIISWTYTFREK
ncbi:hypothetical protein Bhyg_07608 [Pseudolycoriella hygida]|uniref:EF-hand domain-containing protein n=1 Tax=Pseudolycoriella hygida TaxID=35572 RepID=A0A9Q0S400_9DIPT|nr:hypothetical protein Bhyg_07608 [Pseudolycoriella hygida]